jgi:ABC-type dipeptide/oligopeptide/nickel transport system ATPase component
MLNPQVIVAYEPVSALDVSIRAQVLNLMKRLQADHGLTYIVISHDLAVVKYMADRIDVTYLGKLVELGSGTDIYARPAHPYTAGLLAAIPVPEPEIAGPPPRPMCVRRAAERGREGAAGRPGLRVLPVLSHGTWPSAAGHALPGGLWACVPGTI